MANLWNAAGSYTDEDGSLTIEAGPTAMAACPEDSLSEEFLQRLGAAASSQTGGKQLVLSTDPESGALALVFEPVK